MTPHHLGLELRQLVLRQRLESRDLDTRRLQAAIGDGTITPDELQEVLQRAANA